MSVSPDFQTAHDAWRATRMAKLTAPDGWLNLQGRWWIAPGQTLTIGNGADCDARLAEGPALLGRLDLTGLETARFTAADGTVQELDRATGGFSWSADRFLLEITALNDLRSLRIRDTGSEAPAQRGPIPFFPLNPELRLTARWAPLPAPISLTVDTMIGIPTKVPVTHSATLTVGGHEMQLLPTYGSADRPQFVIRDLTSMDDTYAHSRFIFGEDVTADSVVIDFNRAVNPPCAFTRHAVCPLPPRENLFPLRIEAGERRLG
ncbi:DUF1684 domain-containing protein [Pseudooceanicola aestuarii]|uniref:DUF1684 domain-containing protein n=1 Tax=Pseudooceanicola aestuarii TaxID=2697319 RepID=UPI0013D83C7D|nr:DUF1684 domain-containing protein [Pseudooceanicola aestuarii]